MEHYFDFVADGLDLTPVITHRFPLERWEEAVLALKDARRTGAVKVLLEPAPLTRTWGVLIRSHQAWPFARRLEYMTVLRSYTGGTWRSPTGDGTPLHDAVTGEEVARISSEGIDMAAALEYGRAVGGPALAGADLPPARRAAQGARLATCASTATSCTPCPARTGATLADSKFDVDGGIGVLASYASRGPARAAERHRLPRRRRRAARPRRRRSSASTSAPRCAASRCRSTRSTSRSGDRWRSSRPRSSPACRA